MEPESPPTRSALFANLSFDLGELMEALGKMHETIYAMEELLAGQTSSPEVCDLELWKAQITAIDISLAIDAYKVSLLGWEHLVRAQLLETKAGRALLNELSAPS